MHITKINHQQPRTQPNKQAPTHQPNNTKKNNKEAIRHYAELFLGISKYNICLVEIILDYFSVVPSVCKYWGP